MWILKHTSSGPNAIYLHDFPICPDDIQKIAIQVMQFLIKFYVANDWEIEIRNRSMAVFAGFYMQRSFTIGVLSHREGFERTSRHDSHTKVKCRSEAPFRLIQFAPETLNFQTMSRDGLKQNFTALCLFCSRVCQ